MTRRPRKLQVVTSKDYCCVVTGWTLLAVLSTMARSLRHNYLETKNRVESMHAHETNISEPNPRTRDRVSGGIIADMFDARHRGMAVFSGSPELTATISTLRLDTNKF